MIKRGLSGYAKRILTLADLLQYNKIGIHEAFADGIESIGLYR
jgi:hypothetical protein